MTLVDYVIQQGWCDNKRQAINMIKNGFVQVDWRVVLGSYQVTGLERIDCLYSSERESDLLKLHCALNTFCVDVSGQVCLDVGAYSGESTDLFLKYGADLVYALDLRVLPRYEEWLDSDRVIPYPSTDVRVLVNSMFKRPITFAYINVDFISSIFALSPVANLLEKNGDIILLFKMQFEGLPYVMLPKVKKEYADQLEFIAFRMLFATCYRLGLSILDYHLTLHDTSDHPPEYMVHIAKIEQRGLTFEEIWERFMGVYYE